MTSDLFDLSGRVALITGSSRGIGRAIAHQMAARGAYVVVSSRHQEACDAVVAEISQAGGEALAIAATSAEKTSCRHWWIRHIGSVARSISWSAMRRPTRSMGPPPR